MTRNYVLRTSRKAGDVKFDNPIDHVSPPMPSGLQAVLVDGLNYQAKLLKERDLAWLLQVQDLAPDWYPKSKCSFDTQTSMVRVPHWLIKAKNLPPPAPVKPSTPAEPKPEAQPMPIVILPSKEEVVQPLTPKAVEPKALSLFKVALEHLELLSTEVADLEVELKSHTSGLNSNQITELTQFTRFLRCLLLQTRLTSHHLEKP